MKWAGIASFAAVALALGTAGAAAQWRSEAVLGATLGRLRASASSSTAPGFTAILGFGSRSLVFGPEFIWQNGDSLRVRGFAVGVRIRQPGGVIHPHLVASLGAYAWQSRLIVTIPDVAVVGLVPWSEITYLSGSLGAGLTVGRLDQGLSGVLEGRWHRNLSHDADAGPRSLIAVMAGLRVAW